ncbi:MAG: glycosyltransferase [Magnetococcales bacterium]|nr:glycosyltransferase [Magnetococcales bacterium]
MNILFLIRALDRGGAERQLSLLARGLAAAGHAVTVAVFYPGNAFEDELRRSGVELIHLGKRGRWDLLGFLPRLAGVIRRLRPRVVHGYLVEPNLFLALLKPLLPPETRVVWGVRASDMDLMQYHPVTRFTFALSRLLARRADRLIFNSRAGLEFHVRRGYPADRAVVVPNGIECHGLFQPDPAARAALRAEWRVGPERRLVGIAARLDAMKDHGTFLAAAARVAERRPEVLFVVAGPLGNVPVQRLETLAVTQGVAERVIWAGPRDDMRAVYNALDLGVSSSAFGEGFSGVIGEGMACGLPFVATRVGDAAAIIGATGLVVPPRDPAALAAAIDRQLDRLAREGEALRQAARDHILNHFTVDNLVTATARHLADLA